MIVYGITDNIIILYLTAYLLQIFVKFRLKINSLTCDIIYLFIPTCSALLERSHKMLHDLFSNC